MIHHLYKEPQAQDAICDYEAQGDLLPTVKYSQSLFTNSYYAQIDKMRDNLQREYAEKCFAPPAIKFQYLTLTLAAFIFGILIGRFLV